MLKSKLCVLGENIFKNPPPPILNNLINIEASKVLYEHLVQLPCLILLHSSLNKTV